MKRKNLLLLLVLVSISLNLFSQDNGKRKAVYAEFLGSGVMASINYDFRFKPGNDGLGMQAGFGYVPDVLVFPVGLNGLIGKNRVAFEYGAGISTAIFLTEKSGDTTFGTKGNRMGFAGFAKAGMRITPKNNGLFFNLNWNPLINSEEIWVAWFGLGIGYSWK